MSRRLRGTHFSQEWSDGEVVSATDLSSRTSGKTAAPQGRDSGGIHESTLLASARTLIEERRWDAALNLLDRMRELDGDTPEILGLVAVAAAHARRRSVRDEALAKLTAGAPDGRGWESIASSHLANAEFAEADRAARQALVADEESPAAWGALASSFAGLGWFDEAEECLASARRHGGLDPFARWQLGRAINGWAIARNHAPLVAVLATVLLGNLWLGLALAFTTPLAVREFRVGLLAPEVREVAEEQWHDERRIRLVYGFLVLSCLSAWVVLMAMF